MEFKYNIHTGMYELTLDEYLLEYTTSNELVYNMRVSDNDRLESIEVIVTRDEFMRIINNPRLAFVL